MNGDEEAPRPDWDGHLRDENQVLIDEWGDPIETAQENHKGGE